MIVPPIKIQGIKTKLVPLIKEHINLNSESLWLEPFMGSGVVGFNVAPENAVFSDLNPHLINFYNQLKQGGINSDIVRDFLTNEGHKLSDKGESYYYEVRERFNEKNDPLDFLFLNRSCFNGMIRFNKKGLFNVPFCKKPDRFSRSYITKITNQVSNVERLLKFNNWVFVNADFREIIRLYACNPDVFVYCDPPYIGRHVDYYDSWGEQEEHDLNELLMKSECSFMLSTWDHNKYRSNEHISSTWGNFSKITKDHFYFLGGKEINRNAMVEALVINY